MSGDGKDRGVVSFWRGNFGFIRGDDNNHGDIFFHSSQLSDSHEFVRPGMRVSYRLAPSKRRPEKLMAVDVMVLAGR